MSSPGSDSLRQKAPAPDFGGTGAYRRVLDAGGRVHIDRPLPFLVLNRHPDVSFSLAQRVAMISTANVVWPESADADAEAMASIAAVLEHQRRDFPRFLLVSLYDLPRDCSLDEDSPRLEPFRFVISATADDAAQAAAKALEAALQDTCIDLREPVIEHIDHAYAEPGLEPLVEGVEGISRLSLGLPQIYGIPGEESIYPQIFHELESAAFDALLRCVAAFVARTTPGDERHYRSLGRSAFIDAALNVDKELGRISRSFDFLLSVSPINTTQAFEQFKAGKCQKQPVFHYRPLTVNPDHSKRQLYAADINTVEDPVLESLFREKRRELDQQLTMLQCRNTPSFRYASMMQYGDVELPLLQQAQALLEQIDGSGDRCDMTRIDCHAVQAAAEKVIARYRSDVPEFKAQVCLREDIAAGLMVSGQSVLISTQTRMPRGRLDALLQHEVSVHVLTAVNGNQQGLSIFGAGLAGYEGIQEGLGVFAEFAVDGLTDARLRLLAARVLVVDAMLHGAGFIDCHRLLHHEHGFSMRGAFNIVARIFRSGGLTKDAIYLRGLNQVFEFIASGRDLDPFWYGKIAQHHVPVVDELRARGMLRPPAATPEFLSRPSTRRHIERIRQGGTFIDLIRGKT
ncbi:MAG TPA: flavohemoglobin expression-modulating QEGLA motif protein [Lysobacter sp.]|nr:flavohemoglobin expression-modulating QEGLA motif protein [Lysobacter sp.]